MVTWFRYLAYSACLHCFKIVKKCLKVEIRIDYKLTYFSLNLYNVVTNKSVYSIPGKIQERKIEFAKSTIASNQIEIL